MMQGKANSPTPEADLASGLAADFPRLKVFSYTVETLAPVYRAVVRLFFDAKTRYRIHFRPEQVKGELSRLGFDVPFPDGGIERALDQLVEWGNLRRTHDTGRVSTLEDFRRRHFLYQLTPAGEAAERAVGAVVDALGESGSLQTVMLGAIAKNLGLLAQELRRDRPRPAELYEALFNVTEQFRALAENASVFMGRLHEVLDASELDAAVFLTYKEAVVAYLEEFVEELAERAPQITEAIGRVEELGVDRLAEIAARADAAPSLGGERDVAGDLAGKWRGVAAWFLGEEGQGPTVDLLRGAARSAINRILMVLERLHEKRFRRLDRTADLLRLARWFEGYRRADDRAGAHRLAQTAFALFGARHLGGRDEDADLVAPGRSWADAPAATVEPALRETGRRSAPGRTGKVVDHGAARRLLAERHRQRRLETARALARFADRGPLRLSGLPRLDRGELDLLLTLLDRLFATTPDRHGTRRTRSADGRLRLLLEPPEADANAVVHTEAGRLRLPDFTLTVDDLTAARAAS